MGEDTALPERFTQSGGSRMVPVWGFVASVAVHFAALACVIGWQPAEKEMPLALEAVVVLEAAPPPTQHIPAAPESSPSPPSRPTTPPPAPPPSPPPQPAVPPPPTHVPPPPLKKPVPVPERQFAPRHELSAPRPSPSQAPPSPAAVPVGATRTVQADPQGASAASGDAEAADGLARGNAPDAAAMPTDGNPPPAYPASARRAGREGRTVLLAVISPSGECTDVQVLESSGTPSLDSAAVAAVRRWRFRPAMQAGRAVEASVTLPVTFKLTTGPS